MHIQIFAQGWPGTQGHARLGKGQSRSFLKLVPVYALIAFRLFINGQASVQQLSTVLVHAARGISLCFQQGLPCSTSCSRLR